MSIFSRFTSPDYLCPHCGKACVSLLRKLSMGPASSARCASCDKAVGVSPSSFAANLPIVAVLFFGILGELPRAVVFASLIGAVAVSAYLQHRYVALIAR
jgi:hypothetical protein